MPQSLPLDDKLNDAIDAYLIGMRASLWGRSYSNMSEARDFIRGVIDDVAIVYKELSGVKNARRSPRSAKSE